MKEQYILTIVKNDHTVSIYFFNSKEDAIQASLNVYNTFENCLDFYVSKLEYKRNRPRH